MLTKLCVMVSNIVISHEYVTIWEPFLKYWLFVRGIHRWPMDSLTNDQYVAILLNASMNWWSCSIHIQTNASKDFLLKYKITIAVLIVSNIQNISVTHCWPNSMSWYPTKISAMNISRYENHFWNTGPLWGNPPVTDGFPHKWPVCGDFVFSSMLAWTSFQPKQ